MAMQIFRRFIIVIWVMVAIVLGIYGIDGIIKGMFFYRVEHMGFIAIVLLLIPTTLSYIFFGILNPIKLLNYK